MRIMIAGLAAVAAMAFTLPVSAQEATPKKGTAAHCKTLKTASARTTCLKRIQAQAKSAPTTKAKAKTKAKPKTAPAAAAKTEATAAAPPPAAAPAPPQSTIAVPSLPPLPQKTI